MTLLPPKPTLISKKPMERMVVLCGVNEAMQVRDELETALARGELRKGYEIVIVKDEDFDAALAHLKQTFDLMSESEYETEMKKLKEAYEALTPEQAAKVRESL